MAKYFVSMLVPISVQVEADSFEEAIDRAMAKEESYSNYGGDGIYVTNLETNESYEE